MDAWGNEHEKYSAREPGGEEREPTSQSEKVQICPVCHVPLLEMELQGETKLMCPKGHPVIDQEKGI